MHRVGMAESMWGNRNRERHAVGRSSLYSFIQRGANFVRSVIPQMRAFSISSGSFVSALIGIFSVATIICSWLTYLLYRTEERAMHLTASRDTACRSGLFGPLFERGQLYERIWRRQRKISPGASASFIRAPVFHRVALTFCGADPVHSGAGR